MGRHSRNRELKDVRSGVAILVCIVAVSLLLSSASHALTVDPVLDTVMSVATLNDTEGDAGRDNRRGSNKIEKRNPFTTTSASNKTSEAAAGSLPAVSAASEQIVMSAPIEELSSIDASVTIPHTLRIYRPVTTTAVSHEILSVTTPDVAAPLQASAHGWRLFSVAWYWWLVGGFGVFYVARRITRFHRQSATVIAEARTEIAP